MSDCIKSADVCRYLQEIGYVFTDSECATLIWQSDLGILKKHRRLRDLSRTTLDLCLRQEIAERITWDMKYLAKYKDNARYWEQNDMFSELTGELSERFEAQYIDIPHPFKNGDLVRRIGEDWMGIARCDSWEVKREKMNELCTRVELDFIDSDMFVQLPEENGSPQHEHVPITYVEYAL